MPRCAAIVCSDSTRPTPPPLAREPPPELDPAVDLERLSSVGREEPDTLAAHPNDRVERLTDEHFDQIWVGAVLGDSGHVGEERLGRVRAEVRGIAVPVGESGL